jgi:hypothetical protein
MDHEWLTVPIGIDAHRWISRAGCRTVLVVVHSIVSCHRLLDVVDLIESDARVQVVFTVAPDVFNGGVERYLRDLGALVVGWPQAIREPFDLALAASYGGLHELHAPLVVMAHGAGHSKVVRPPRQGGPLVGEPAVYGLDTQRLIRDGRVLPSAIVVAHDAEREVLRRQCPDALPAVVVTGDVCFDRLAASMPLRPEYRRALQVGDAQTLVVVSSTWGRDGTFGGIPDLLPTIVDALPADRFRVAALLHPAVWGAHGRRQVQAWTRDCREAGLILPDPTDDWRALIAAADRLVGDHGSVTAYAAAVGVPVLRLGTARSSRPARESAQAFVLRHAGRLDLRRPLRPQLLAARPLDAARVAGVLTSHPREASGRLRSMIYRLLRLPEPGQHRQATPVPVPATAFERSVARS